VAIKQFTASFDSLYPLLGRIQLIGQLIDTLFFEGTCGQPSHMQQLVPHNQSVAHSENKSPFLLPPIVGSKVKYLDCWRFCFLTVVRFAFDLHLGLLFFSFFLNSILQVKALAHPSSQKN